MSQQNEELTDERIGYYIGSGHLALATARMEFRKMKALESIAASLLKAANPPTIPKMGPNGLELEQTNLGSATYISPDEDGVSEASIGPATEHGDATPLRGRRRRVAGDAE